MKTKKDTSKYSLILRSLHWTTAILIISLLAIGFYMTSLAPDAANKYDLYPTHKAFGMITLSLVLIRLPARRRSHVPAPAENLKKWEHNLAHAVHLLLYFTMLGMTISGYFMNSTYDHAHGIDMFGLFTFPDITEKSEYWNAVTHTVHSICAWMFVVLLSAHLAGVFKHRLFDSKEHDVLKRMT